MASRKQHPAELRERAVAMVFELRAESGNPRGSIARPWGAARARNSGGFPVLTLVSGAEPGMCIGKRLISGQLRVLVVLDALV